MTDDVCRTNGEAVIEDGLIVIRVDISALPMIVEYAGEALAAPYRVTDPEVLAKAIVDEINDEDEIGGTEFHKFFDRITGVAISRGAEGVEELSVSGGEE